MGKKNCISCRGSTKLTCYSCKGSGKDKDGDPCSSCGGQGSTDCPYCEDGQVDDGEDD